MTHTHEESKYEKRSNFESLSLSPLFFFFGSLARDTSRGWSLLEEKVCQARCEGGVVGCQKDKDTLLLPDIFFLEPTRTARTTTIDKFYS